MTKGRVQYTTGNCSDQCSLGRVPIALLPLVIIKQKPVTSERIENQLGPGQCVTMNGGHGFVYTESTRLLGLNIYLSVALYGSGPS